MGVFKDDKKFNLAEAYHNAFGKAILAVEEAYERIPAVQKRKKRNLAYRLIKYAFRFVLMLFIVLVIGLIVYGITFRNVYGHILNGKANLDNAIYFAKAKNFERAVEFADSAKQDFSAALEHYEMSRDSFFAKAIPGINTQFLNGYYLLSTVQLVADASHIALSFLNDMYNLMGVHGVSYSELSPDLKREALAYIYESGNRLAELRGRIDLARENIGKVKFPIFLWFANIKIGQIRDQIVQAESYVDRAIPGSKIIPVLLGYPDKNAFLFLLQNKDELRPTGGFIGTYGVVESDSGDFTRFETHDIYHLDMPIKDKLRIKPPLPLEKYLGAPYWYLRDSNWSPDYPTSALKAVWFYNEENKLQEKPDPIASFKGVIAITPEFIIDLLDITGPITIEGQEYNKDNFTQLLEYRVEKGYVQLGISSWERKEVIGDISKELKARILDLDAASWPAVFKVLNDSMLKKDILVYFFDPELEGLAIEQGIAGEIKEPDRSDFLMVVDANMAAYKTDSVMDKAISYTVQNRDDGAYALLEINYLHQGSFDFRTTRYRTYTRVYAPQGSELLKADGYTEGGAAVSRESGKTVFEVFLSVEPGEMGTLTFLYKLPPQISAELDANNYKLYVQKQPGSDIAELNVDLQTRKPIKSYAPTGFSSEKTGANRIKWHSALETDMAFTAVLSAGD